MASNCHGNCTVGILQFQFFNENILPTLYINNNSFEQFRYLVIVVVYHSRETPRGTSTQRRRDGEGFESWYPGDDQGSESELQALQ